MLPKIGESVVIFEDPVTQLLPEGTATLVQRTRRLPGLYQGSPAGTSSTVAGHLHLYKVRFDNETDIRQRTHWTPAPVDGSVIVALQQPARFPFDSPVEQESRKAA